jgi:uncharacterized protein
VVIKKVTNQSDARPGDPTPRIPSARQPQRRAGGGEPGQDVEADMQQRAGHEHPVAAGRYRWGAIDATCTIRLYAAAMTLATLAVLGLTIVATSFIAGIFGMAGGMILLGVLLVYFDVATAMVMFSLLQFSANVSRVIVWRGYVIWPIFIAYVIGSAAAFIVMSAVAFVPNKPMVYLVLGAIPIAVDLLPKAWRPNIEWRGVPYLCGFVTTGIQLIAGSGGLFLDVFFQKSMIDRRSTVATKAVAHTFGHVCRLGYFIPLGGVGAFEALPLWALAVSIVLAVGATSLAPLVLDRMSDHDFRRWTHGIILAVSVTYLARAAWLYWHGAAAAIPAS